MTENSLRSQVLFTTEKLLEKYLRSSVSAVLAILGIKTYLLLSSAITPSIFDFLIKEVSEFILSNFYFQL